MKVVIEMPLKKFLTFVNACAAMPLHPLESYRFQENVLLCGHCVAFETLPLAVWMGTSGDV